MKLHIVIVGADGNIHSTAIVNGTPLEMLKAVIKAPFLSDSNKTQIDQFFADNGLNKMTAHEVVNWINLQIEEDEESICDTLGLYEVADEPVAYLGEVMALLDGEVDHELHEVSETQTTIIAKVG